ncbi:hypothetical protein BDR07DRAFT_1611930, partial [Suillus spraguei]
MMAESNSSVCCADGSLKDASEIAFYHDADDDIPLPPSGTQPALSNAFLDSTEGHGWKSLPRGC